MKKRAIIPITVSVFILALVALLVASFAPSMHVASVDPERVVLEADAPCAYDVWINHAPECADCRYYDGAMVVSATNVSRIVAYWDALNLYNGMPASGDCFCGFWYCHGEAEAEYHGGELWDVVAWRLWLPLVMSDG